MYFCQINNKFLSSQNQEVRFDLLKWPVGLEIATKLEKTTFHFFVDPIIYLFPITTVVK